MVLIEIARVIQKIQFGVICFSRGWFMQCRAFQMFEDFPKNTKNVVKWGQAHQHQSSSSE